MGGKFDRSMRLFSASWSVLREDKSLILYPFISALSGLIVMATFAIPIFTMFVHTQTNTVYSYTDQMYVHQNSFHMDPAGWVLLGIGYFLLIYVGIFCNAALIYAANERLTGTGPGTLGSGFRGAASKAGAFVPWAVLSATVTLALRMVEERLGIIGKIVISLIGLAWTLVTYLVVPIIVLEEGFTTGHAIKRSSQLFKKTWGENVIGNAGFGLFSLGLILTGAALFAIGIVSGSAVGIVVLGLLAFAWILIGSEVIAAMSGVYRVALYRYAMDGQAPSAYVMYDFENAFRPKKSSGLFTSTRSQTVYRSGPQGAQPQRDVWKQWQPPVEEGVQGEFGIEIPGAQVLPGHDAPPPAAPPPPPPPPGSSGGQNPPNPPGTYGGSSPFG